MDADAADIAQMPLRKSGNDLLKKTFALLVVLSEICGISVICVPPPSRSGMSPRREVLHFGRLNGQIPCFALTLLREALRSD
jgi:hypothetical protein